MAHPVGSAKYFTIHKNKQWYYTTKYQNKRYIIQLNLLWWLAKKTMRKTWNKTSKHALENHCFYCRNNYKTSFLQYKNLYLIVQKSSQICTCFTYYSRSTFYNVLLICKVELDNKYFYKKNNSTSTTVFKFKTNHWSFFVQNFGSWINVCVFQCPISKTDKCGWHMEGQTSIRPGSWRWQSN